MVEVKKLDIPSYVRVLVVPDSQPKTKPKACNWGLAHAKGEYVVIYDAEDIPDPKQLKTAFAAFRKVPANTVCLQAKLNFYNPHHNLLTRLFTAEYSLWFDVVLTGLQSIETSIPLGGTSNHFRTEVLRTLHGWDAFNVTEDCDLGTRLFKAGYKTAVIDSTTLEEANSKLTNWLRQRSRWIKGYLQTYLVHMRNPIDFTADHGIHAFIFQLVVGGKIAFMFINPFLWLATISYFALYALVGPTIEALYPTVIFYMAVTSLIFGNFLFIFYYMIGCARRGHWSLIKYVYLVPFYWLMVSVSATIALVQLIVKPHFWEKTHHGYHLGKNPMSTAIKSPTVTTGVNKRIGRIESKCSNVATTGMAPIQRPVAKSDRRVAF
jgi:cellulose synthase/poly-beta-1,6-N-acetylglucosamine synthase-like glycosyltransferase